MNKYTCPSSMQSNSSRGLALLQKAKSLAHKDTLEMIEPLSKGIQQGDLTLEEVKQLYTFLNKAKEQYQPKTKVEVGIPNSNTCKFLAAGGNAGLAWTTKMLQDAGIVKSITEPVKQDCIDNEDSIPGVELQVAKSLNEELMQVTYVAMQEGVDLTGDYTSADEVRKAKESFNHSMQRANLFHMVMTDSFSVSESYLAPVDMVIGAKFVQKGTWLMTLQIHEPEVWQMVKSGEINGISIGAMAKVHVLEPEE